MSMSRARQARKEMNMKKDTDKEKVHIRNYTLQSSFASLNMNNTTPPPQRMNMTAPPSPPKLVHRFLPGSDSKAGVFEKLIVKTDNIKENMNGDSKRKSQHTSYLPSYLSSKSDTQEHVAVTPTISNRKRRKKVSWSNKDELVNDAITNDYSHKKGDKNDCIDTYTDISAPIKPSAIDEAWSAECSDVSHHGNNETENDLW